MSGAGARRPPGPAARTPVTARTGPVRAVTPLEASVPYGLVRCPGHLAGGQLHPMRAWQLAAIRGAAAGHRRAFVEVNRRDQAEALVADLPLTDVDPSCRCGRRRQLIRRLAIRPSRRTKVMAPVPWDPCP